MIFKQDKLKHLLAGIGISLVFGVQFPPLNRTHHRGYSNLKEGSEKISREVV
jgi:hypothetical protein